MAGSTFQTNPYDLNKLLDDCHHGVLQLPDFQRSWVWDEDRIKCERGQASVIRYFRFLLLIKISDRSFNLFANALSF